MTRAFLAWLAIGAAIPLLLHLFTRTRPRPRAWAAWRFLPQPEPIDERVRRIDQPWLLALRTLAVLALVGGAVGPTCTRLVASELDLGDLRNPLFIVDGSASMLQGRAGNRPLDRAAVWLDRVWRRYNWSKGAVAVCRGTTADIIFDASRATPGAFLSALEQGTGLGDAVLAACAGAVEPQTDLVIVSDSAPDWSGLPTGRSRRWYAVGQPTPPANSGIDTLASHIRNGSIVLDGHYTGTDRPLIAVRWNQPLRPPATARPDEHGRFRFELLLPDEPGRLTIEVRRDAPDAAPWDDRVPVWVPTGGRPSVQLLGVPQPDEAMFLTDLLYAASDRLHFATALEHDNVPTSRTVFLLAGQEPADLLDTAWSRVEAGAIAIARPVESHSGDPRLRWTPGWIHPVQDAATPGVRPTTALLDRWPQLADLDWSVIHVQRIYPLADPLPELIVLLETADGLPLLVAHREGAGEIFTWLTDFSPASSNLPVSPVWAPLWLAIMNTLDDPSGTARIVDAESAELARLRDLRLIGTAYARPNGRGSLAWYSATHNGRLALYSTRTPSGEIPAGTASGMHVDHRADSGSAPANIPVSEPLDLWFLAAGALLWLLQASWSSRAGVAVLLLLAMPSGALADDLSELQIWVPIESGAAAAELDGIAHLTELWEQRSSPEFSPSPVPFRWAATRPADPLVWWAGCHAFRPDRDPALARATLDFLSRGGTLLIDYCGGPAEYRQYARKIGRWLKQYGPGGTWRELPGNHVLNRTFYLLDGWHDPERAGRPWLYRAGDLERIFLVPNLMRGLSVTPLGNWNLPLPAATREWLIRQGLNLMMYATTYDYKDDAIHLPYILERRKRHR
ncbi:MAG: DUF4159 domain-containing protein [Candidatus Dadabacteria bacterium]|nr:MAG: DUF4159 domain-containing protein [Candidatus Dadabacteria bacterium]